MGELAMDYIDGSCCEICGCYFQHPDKDELFTHGYPAVCRDCWDEMSKKERKGHTRAITRTI